ncbi:MAG: hypothetical protein RL497_2052, partial [Pseudomonadota bacterium]
MRFLKTTLILSLLVTTLGCTSTHEKASGWHRTDGKQIDPS